MKRNIISNIPIIFLVLIFISSLMFTNCSNDKRIEELENRVSELQEKLTEKENIIRELQQEKGGVAEKIENVNETKQNNNQKINEEDIIIEIINNYILAVEDENFDEQRKYVAKYALDLVNFKEEEYRNHQAYIKERTVEKQNPKIISINNNSAEGFMSFTEHITYTDDSKYDLVTEGKVLLEKINNNWKIIDYTRKNHLISEAFYLFDDNIKTNQNNIDIQINRVLFSLYDKYILVEITINNGNQEPIDLALYDSVIIGPDKIQNKSIYYDDNLCNNIFPGASVVGNVEYDWTNSAVGDFTLYSGDIFDKDGYKLFNSIPVEIILDKAIRY